MKIKLPHIQWTGSWWACGYPGDTYFGSTPAEAYENWLWGDL